MGVDHESELLDALQNIVGRNLRVVATYDREGYDIVYTRGEIDERVKAYADAVHNELVLQGIGRDHLEDLFVAGDLHCSMHRFDELTAFHFVQEEYTGLFVSIDSDASVDLNEFSETVKTHLH